MRAITKEELYLHQFMRYKRTAIYHKVDVVSGKGNYKRWTRWSPMYQYSRKPTNK
jgi:hypothetical protein